MKDIIDLARSLVLRECCKRNISVRQFLLELGENGRFNWDNLIRSSTRSSTGKYNLFIKILKHFDLIIYDDKTKNSL